MKNTFLVITFLALYFPASASASASASAADDQCSKYFEQSQLNPTEPPTLERNQAYRLASMVRSQAENILGAESISDTNIKWIESQKLFVSKYATESKDQVDILYTEEGLADSYRLKKSGVSTYFCMNRQINSLEPKSKKNAKHKK